MIPSRWNRALTGLLLGLVGITAAAGGAALVAGEITGDPNGLFVPDSSYLEGTPFASYVVPGLLLAIVVGGVQLAALAVLVRRPALAPAATSMAAYTILIWIFVQMIIIPFSPLQLAYFLAGLAELGLVIVAAGVLTAENPRVDVRSRVDAR
ncbi:hypothetical protein ITJ64_05455 [Herbiconiux sp. VKM Ac-1786]|uniref:hypothetical protein n=1 Tax=Herbiconiux sp. VKM Ac-1786 TaxID=2783824 RepID=UPI00188C55B1|nr:hypothetical protein [Herbiconiux sp. VKM Ac-1786]MBF4571958.1 hypothetical protein [Herbiconiux sp. VKM Ac-1786]